MTLMRVSLAGILVAGLALSACSNDTIVGEPAAAPSPAGSSSLIGTPSAKPTLPPRPK